MSARRLSIVIPVLNEEQSLSELYERLVATLEQELPLWEPEIVFVNDGSTDTTRAILDRLAAGDRRVVALHLPSQQGKSSALAAGFARVKGDAVVTLDGDLQDRPENIPQLIAALTDDIDLVVGWKRVRHDSPSKIFFSKIFNICVRAIWRVPLHDVNCGMKVMRGRVAQRFISLNGDAHRFIPIFVKQVGGRVVEVPITHDARKYGLSKYGWGRIGSGLTSFLSLLLLGNVTRQSQRAVALGSTGILILLVGLWFYGRR